MRINSIFSLRKSRSFSDATFLNFSDESDSRGFSLEKGLNPLFPPNRGHPALRCAKNNRARVTGQEENWLQNNGDPESREATLNIPATEDNVPFALPPCLHSFRHKERKTRAETTAHILDPRDAQLEPRRLSSSVL